MQSSYSVLSACPVSTLPRPEVAGLDFLGYTPCPLQAEMRTRLGGLLEGNPGGSGGASPAWAVPIGCGQAERYKDIWRVEDEAMLPSLISDFGNGDYWGEEFRERWIEPGVFAPQPGFGLRPEFCEAGMADPQGIFHIYGVLPYIILADLKKLGGRPLPCYWSDLLDPQYRGDLIIGGTQGRPGEVILYNFHKDYGEEGLTALGANVRTFWHGAQMAKTAGSGNPNGAALYVLPWFLAINNPHREHTTLVWPEDGLLSIPLYLLAKRNPGRVARRVMDFLTGPAWASMISRIGFPSSPVSAGAVPGKLKWIGWDYLRDHPLEALREPLSAAFKKGRNL